MSLFLALATLLTVLALAFVLPGLLRRDASALQRVERWPAAVLALTIPLFAAGVYRAVGQPAAWMPAEVASVESLIAQGASGPGDAAAWRSLARAHEAAGRFEAAVDAYRHLATLRPDDAGLLLDFAVTLAMSAGQHLDGEPDRLIQRVLVLDPKNVQALALSGSVRYERGDYAGAVALWRQVLAQLPANAAAAGSIADSLARAESLAGSAMGSQSSSGR
jgi:cytochrome c-type biogenesis protein CcmH